MKDYVCFDGVENEVTYHDTEEAALDELKALISESLEDGEWMDGVEMCFVAKITHGIEQVELEADGEEGMPEACYDMRIKETGAL